MLIADDHAIVREGLTAILATDPEIAVIGTATNGRSAVALADELQPRVVILDISMPELDGIAATRQILAKRPETLVAILSMHSDSQHVFHALEAGARGYLLKESVGVEIIEAVHAMHAGRRFLSPKVAEIIAVGLSRGKAISPLDSLSARESQVLKLVADGHSSAEIGRKLHLSPKTVDTYRSRLMRKLHVSDVVGLIKLAIQYGLTSIE